MLTLAAAETIAGIAGTTTAISYALFGVQVAGGVETYKKLAQGQLGTAAATIYTSPTATQTFVKSVHLVNVTTSEVNGVALFMNGTTSGFQITGSFSIPANGWAVCQEDGWRIYDSNGSVLCGNGVLASSLFIPGRDGEDGEDYRPIPGANGVGVPTGGTSGQFLKKNSATSFDTAWATGRPQLTANTDYYVRSDGSDANTGLINSAGGAFLTLQKAIDTVAALDIATYNVTIHVADATYTAGIIVNGPWIGSGTVTIVGNTTTPANCIIAIASGTADNIVVRTSGALTVGGFKLTNAGTGNCIQATQGGAFNITGAMDYGSCPSNCQLRASFNGTINITANYTISGGASFHQLVSAGGSIGAQSLAITVTGTPAFGAFSLAAFGIVFNSGSVFTGAATGPRYSASLCGCLQTGNTGNPNYYPGNSAGATSSGGQYL